MLRSIYFTDKETGEFKTVYEFNTISKITCVVTKEQFDFTSFELLLKWVCVNKINMMLTPYNEQRFVYGCSEERLINESVRISADFDIKDIGKRAISLNCFELWQYKDDSSDDDLLFIISGLGDNMNIRSQFNIVEKLKNSYKNSQFIVTTTCPIVLSQFDNSEVLNLDIVKNELVKDGTAYPRVDFNPKDLSFDEICKKMI